MTVEYLGSTKKASLLLSVRRVPGGFEVRCRRCQAPIVLPFEPTTPKLCDACYAARSPEDIECAEKDNRRQDIEAGRRMAFTQGSE